MRLLVVHASKVNYNHSTARDLVVEDVNETGWGRKRRLNNFKERRDYF
jgi:hypothetical protein